MRAFTHVINEYNKLRDKVWWNRHMAHHKTDQHDYTEGAGCERAVEIEKKYTRASLDPGEPIEWGITIGKMMALAWVLGSNWEETGDT